jgi:hypothetical protein
MPLPNGAKDRYDRVQFMSPQSNQYVYPRDTPPEPVFFFPPAPPPLGMEILLAPAETGSRAPQELTEFANELFYPQLGTRLFEDDLSKNVWGQVRAYREAKMGLLSDLRVHLAAINGDDAKEAADKLEEFAHLQAPRIAALEEAAEELRVALKRTGPGGLFTGKSDWNDWRLRAGQQPAPTAGDIRREAEVFRAAAFYQDGFSTAQRQLLREASMELREQLDGSPGGSPSPGPKVIYFSPETSRIEMPAGMPQDLQRKVDDYVSEKRALKQELRDALERLDSSGSEERLAAFRRLAAAQAARLAAVQSAAEDIRRGLRDLHYQPGPPAPPALSTELTARISTYREHKRDALESLRSLLVPQEAPAVDPGSANDYRSKTGPGISAWLRDNSTTTQVRPADLRVSASEFDKKQTELLAELNKEQAGIRAALSEYVRSQNKPSDRKSINDLLKDFEAARQKEEIWDKYRDYRTAALTPGLSPEQRRLLFDAAVEELALPLPAGKPAR